MIISSHFSEPFSFVVINEKPLKKVVTKKVTKRLDVTIGIILNKWYSTAARCNEQCYNETMGYFKMQKVVEFLQKNPVQYLATVGRDGSILKGETLK